MACHSIFVNVYGDLLANEMTFRVMIQDDEGLVRAELSLIKGFSQDQRLSQNNLLAQSAGGGQVSALEPRFKPPTYLSLPAG